MIDILANEEVDKILRRVDIAKSLLITGRAETSYAANRISYYDSAKKARADYGEGDLADAIEVAIKLGAPHVFAINVRKKHDYIDLMQVFRQYEFAFIAPIDIKFSDYFYDSNRGNAKITYIRDYLERAASFNHSVFLLTDKHASLYEDMDSYLDEMLLHTTTMMKQSNIAQKGRNTAFVSNNLEDYMFSNVVLGAVLAGTATASYPKLPSNTGVIFDFDYLDVVEVPMIYFKNNHITGPTVENLVNLDKKITPVKFMVTDRIIKHIQRTLDLTSFHGKPYTTHQKVQVEKALEEYFDALMGVMIRNYEIKSVVFYKENIGVGSIECEIDIYPVSSIERYTIFIE